MNQSQGDRVTGEFRKVLLLIVDGLRPDAVTPEVMPVLSGLSRAGWSAAEATTVRPSVTVAALTSLATGVSPERHGLVHPRLTSLGRVPGLVPLPIALRRMGVATTVVAPVLGGAARWVTGALLRLGGITRLLPALPAPALVIEGATDHLRGNSKREFVVAYVNDLDIAGHAWGWMSAPYLQAAAAVDRGLAQLRTVLTDPRTLVIVCADHGGGGVLHNDHDHPHPVNDRIPLFLLGQRVQGGATGMGPVRLLDVPPTVIWALGGTAPAQYEGRVLNEAFITELISV